MRDEAKGVAQLVEELTETRRRVRELEEANARLEAENLARTEPEATSEAMVQAFDGLIYVCSNTYEVEFMNDRFIERTGRNPIGEKCYLALHNRDEVCPWCVNERVFRGETVRWEVLSPKDNRWYYVVNTPVWHSDGTMSKMAMIQDVTERKQTEKSLLQMSKVFREANDPIVIEDLEGTIIDLNEAAEQVFGWSRDELLGQPMKTIVPPERHELSDLRLERCKRGEKIRNVEGVRLTKWEETIPVLLSLSLLTDDAGEPVAIANIAKNLTEQKRAEDELRKRTVALEMSNKDLEQFAYMAAHDLREPLIAVSAYLRILEQRYTNQLDPDVHKFLSRAIDTTCRMDTLIQNILAYSRLGSDMPIFETTDSATCLRQALSNLQAAIEESGAQVRSDPLPRVMGNPAQLVQLFQNLVSNAIKFRGDRPVEIHVGVERETSEYRFWVRDNGIGIESPHVEGIFRLFQRVENGSGRSGSGIGLANCKKIVEHHGGRIWVESEPGRGSAFFFTIPRDQDAAP